MKLQHLILSLFIFSQVIVENAHGVNFYRVDSSLIPITVDEFSNCRTVTNSSGPSIFIPTNSANEWNAFLTSPPSGATLGSCTPNINCLGTWGACSLTCGDGIQIYTITTPASGSGAACTTIDGATRACNNNCPPPINGICNNSVALGCVAGSAINDNGQITCGTIRNWQCSGSNGGSNSPICSKSNGNMHLVCPLWLYISYTFDCSPVSDHLVFLTATVPTNGDGSAGDCEYTFFEHICIATGDYGNYRTYKQPASYECQ